MDLSAKEIYQVLKSKGINGLYHANTVKTAKTFLENGALLSRKYIEEKGLAQTSQESDEKDKVFEIWDDIFLDAINISNYFSRPNEYGPVLFGFSLELLVSGNIETVKITKKNPIYWNEKDTESDKYFQTVEQFAQKFKSGNKLSDGGNHITLTTVKGVLPFEHLFGIQIDNPNVNIVDEKGNKIPLSERTVDYFSKELNKHSLTDKVTIKESKLLKWQYQIMEKLQKEKFKRFFSRNG